MLISNKLVFIALLIFISQSSLAAVFKCEENGTISFSDKPCTGKARDITHQQLNVIPKKAPEVDSSRSSKIKKMADDMEAIRIERETKHDISLLDKEMTEKLLIRDEKLLALKEKKQLIGDGDDFDDEPLAVELKKAITNEMTSIKNQYTSEIEALNKEKKDLQNKLIKLKR